MGDPKTNKVGAFGLALIGLFKMQEQAKRDEERKTVFGFWEQVERC